MQRSNESVIKLTASSMANSEIIFQSSLVEVKTMVAFLRLVAQLTAKQAIWAWANKKKVLEWIGQGFSFKWISNQIIRALAG
ncbi:aureocin A53 family class IId bacteriocin [Bacillus altitudinis]